MSAGGTGLLVEGLAIGQRRRTGRIVDGVDLAVAPGECVGLVGESGSGKSLTLRAIAGLLPSPLVVVAGSIRVDGDAGRGGRGRVAMVFQDPAAALNPLMRVGAQVAAVRRHVIGRSARDAKSDTIRLLADVRLPEPEALYARYPHELSGGQRQRVMIAFALASEPAYLLCDEPTTALDVTVQAEVLSLIDQIRRDRGIGVLFVSHDLPVVAQMSSRIAIMRAGAVIETGETLDVLREPRDPYTRGLIAAARAVAVGGRAS